jgi:hypothetical protein
MSTVIGSHSTIEGAEENEVRLRPDPTVNSQLTAVNFPQVLDKRKEIRARI